MKNISQRLPLTFFEQVRPLIAHKIPLFFNEPLPSKEKLAAKMITAMSPGETNKIAKLPGGRTFLMKEKEVALWLQQVLERRMSVINDMLFNVADAGNNINLNHFYNSRFVGVNAEGILSVQSEGQHREEIADMLTAMWYFNENGKKTFRIEKELTEELAHTDCSKIDDEFFQLPYDSICISLPFNETVKLLGQNLRWLYIRQEDLYTIDESTKSVFSLFAILEDGRFYAEDFFLAGGDIESQIKEQMMAKYGKATQGIEENTSLFSFVTAIILYMNSEDVDETEVHPENSKITPSSRLPVCSLGRNIVIHKNSMAANPGASRGPVTINVLKWTVRGHFRRQKVGSQRQEVRIIWIRPYIKGRERLNDDLDAKPTNYTLK